MNKMYITIICSSLFLITQILCMNNGTCLSSNAPTTSSLPKALYRQYEVTCTTQDKKYFGRINSFVSLPEWEDLHEYRKENDKHIEMICDVQLPLLLVMMAYAGNCTSRWRGPFFIPKISHNAGSLFFEDFDCYPFRWQYSSGNITKKAFFLKNHFCPKYYYRQLKDKKTKKKYEKMINSYQKRAEKRMKIRSKKQHRKNRYKNMRK